MKEYQRITLEETGVEMVVGSMEYLYQHIGMLYIKFIKYEYIKYNDDTLTLTAFIILQPQDILKRECEWNREDEDEMI